MARKKTPVKAPESARGVASLEAAREWLAGHSTEDIECVVPDQAGVGRGKMMPVAEIPRRADHVAADLDPHPDDHRRLPGGRRELPARSRRPGHPLRARLRDACRGAVGDRSDRADHPRRLSSRRAAGRDRAAPGAPPRHRALRAPRLAAGGGAGDRVLPGQAQHRSRLSAGAADRPLGPAGIGTAVLFDRRGQRVRRRSSTTSTTTRRRRGSRSTR